MDTEALSEDEVEKPDTGGFEEISFDYTTLNPSCLVPPTIPNTLGADDIDKVMTVMMIESDGQLSFSGYRSLDQCSRCECS